MKNHVLPTSVMKKRTGRGSFFQDVEVQFLQGRNFDDRNEPAGMAEHRPYRTSSLSILLITIYFIVPELLQEAFIIPARRLEPSKTRRTPRPPPPIALPGASLRVPPDEQAGPNPAMSIRLKTASADDQPLPEEIPGRPGVRSDDGPLLPEQGIEESRFPDVRPAGDGQRDPFHQRPAGVVSGDELFDRRR